MPTLRITMLFVALCSAAPAAAQVNRNVSLNWVRAPEADGCTSAKGVAQRVQSYFDSDQLLSEERFQFVSSGSAHVAIEALVTPYQDGWQVAIGLSHGEVRVPGTDLVHRSRSCEQLEVQAALVISQLLDSPNFPNEPVAAAETNGAVVMASYVVDVEPTVLPVTAQPSRATTMVRADASKPLRVRLMTGGSIDRGVFPTTGFGARIGAAVEPPRLFPIELHAGFSTSNGNERFPNGLPGIANGASASFNGAKLIVLGCPASWALGRFGIAGCAGLAGNAVNTRLHGFRRDDSEWVSWLGLELAVRPAFEISSTLAVWAEAGASFTVVESSEFVTRGIESQTDDLRLFGAPRQTAQLLLGLSYVL